MRKTILFFLIHLCVLSAQTEQESLEWLLSEELSEAAIEYLDELLRQPLNLNRASRQDLQRLPFLSPGQTDTLLSWRKLHGEFTSPGRVKMLLGPETYGMILPFIEVSSPRYPSYLQFRQYFDPDAPGAVQGKINQLIRGRYVYSNGLAVGYVAQKDFREPSWTDYTSGFVVYYSDNWQGGAGRFRLSTGQGLLFSNPFSRQTGSLAMLPFSAQKNDLRETLSSSENDNLFGLWMLRVWSPKWRSGFFYSYDGRDAIMGSEQKISGITDRYHISETDLELKNKVDEQITGSFLEWKPIAGFQAAFTAAQVVYHPGFDRSQPNISEEELSRNYYHWRGQGQFQVSLSTEFQSAAGVFQAEAGGGPEMSPAFNFSFFRSRARLSSGFEIWQISRNFQSPHGRYLGSASDFPRASRGLYSGLNYNINSAWRADFSHLFGQDLWRSYFDDLPLSRHETTFSLRFKSVDITGQAKIGQKVNEDLVEIDNQSVLKSNRSVQYRIDLIPAPQNSWRWHSRVEINSYNNQTGLNWFQELRRTFFPGFDLTVRYSSFYTSGWNTRIYEYEPDLPGSFAIYPVSGDGSKWLALLHYKAGKQLDTYFKWRSQLTRETEPLSKSFDKPEAQRDQQLRWYFRWNF